MIASHAERAAQRAAGFLLLHLALCGCYTPAPAPLGSALEPLPTMAARVPDDPDLVARDLAASALAEPRAASAAAVERLEALDRERRAQGLAPTGLVPVAADLANATLDDPIAYRRATAAVLERDDLSLGLRKRLEADVADDPLRLADERLRDAVVKDTAEVFNALIAPLSRIALTPIQGALALTRSVTDLMLAERTEDALELQERQALGHWKRFLDLHPDAPQAPEIARRTEETQLRWNRTRRDRALRSARQALEDEKYAAALVLAQRAERYAPEDEEALEVREKAAARLEHLRAQRARSLEADPATSPEDRSPAARDLALALLAPDGDVAGRARAILEDDPEGRLADEARFALAISRHESPGPRAETEGWDLLEDVAGEGDRDSNMARHAEALVESPDENPWSAFQRSRSSDRADKTKWIFFGPLGGGPRDRDLPTGVEWLIDVPSYVQTLTAFPNRLVRLPFWSGSPFGRTPVVHARNYLARYPEGAHAHEAAGWLAEWQGDHDNWLAAWEVARGPGGDPQDAEELRPRAAQQALEAARRQTRPDTRLNMLRHVAREFSGSEAASEAALDARRELEEASTQRIRISRGFLRENPVVAGPEGLALRPELLDGESRNGELHPSGVVLAGGRWLEFHYLAESGRSKDEPVVRREKVSEERLARLVTLLDETATRNYLEDPGEILGPDADRDLFFERARLGVADDLDRRPSAQSTYAFVGMRERYGLVRGRESILPFDIVVRGSLPDLGLSAFPRLRTPKPTPDALLYQ